MKDILVNLSESEASAARLNVALELCERFDSHLTGISGLQQVDYGYYDNVIGATLIDTIREQREAQENRIQAHFFKAVATRAGKCTFIAENNTTVHNPFAHAALSDLIVTGQRNPNQNVPADSMLTEDLIMQTGRPVLVVPYIGARATIAENILVAWDHSREASRAIHDALPLLKAASSVHIVSVKKKHHANENIESADIAEHLARHDVNVTAHDVIQNEVPVAETLLSKISDTGADMLVMGGYGHSRLREYAFGGVSKTMLGSMTVPVLMTH